jgi:hypothetical protein
MKTNKVNKKLVFKKNTVANLNNAEMGVLKGGVLWQSHVDPEACANQTGDSVCESCVSCYQTCPMGTCQSGCSVDTLADCPASIAPCL